MLGSLTVRHGRRTRTGAALILLHGAAGSWTTWTPLLAAADACAAHSCAADTRAAGSLSHALADLVIPDLPGWGDSPSPADVASFTAPAIADAVAEVARSLGYRRWTVLGHSLGGFVALELAARQPEATESVGLVSATTFSVIDSVRHPLAQFGQVPAFTALLGVMRVFGLADNAGRALVRALDRLQLLWFLVAPLFRHAARVDRSIVAALAHEARPRAFARAAAHAAGGTSAAAWPGISCPVRSVHGDHDVFVAPSDDLRLAAALGDFEATTIPDCGHFGHIERPFSTLSALLPASTGHHPGRQTHHHDQRGTTPNRRSARAGLTRRTWEIRSAEIQATATSVASPIVTSSTPIGSTTMLLPTPTGGV